MAGKSDSPETGKHRPLPEFVSSKRGKKYHTLECGRALKIIPEERVFYYSRQEAQNAGKFACSCVRRKLEKPS